MRISDWSSDVCSSDLADPVRAEALRGNDIVAFPLERLPRTTRAQAMDVLSSQAGMAGYKAVLIGAQLAPRFFPMLTTAAGTIRPSKGLVVGAGVARSAALRVGNGGVSTCRSPESPYHEKKKKLHKLE